MKKKSNLFLKTLLMLLSVLLLVTTFPVRITADDESGTGSEVDQQEILEQEEDSAGSDVQDTDNVDEIVGGSSSDPVDFSYEDEQYVLPSDGFAQALQTGTSNAKSLPAGVAAIVTFSSGDKTFVYYFDSSNKTILLSDIFSELGLGYGWYLASYVAIIDRAHEDEEGEYFDPAIFSASHAYGGDWEITLERDIFTEEVTIKVGTSDQNTIYITATNDAILGVRTWNGLQQAINSEPDSTQRTIVLIDHIKNDNIPEQNAIVIPNKKKIILDLNGMTLNGGWYDYDPRDPGRNRYAGKNRHVLQVNKGAELTVTDNNGNDEGAIMGGCAYHGGGIYIEEGGKCTIEHGTIRDNGADNTGAGIYTEGTLVMTGGAVVDNHAFDNEEDNTTKGGGIHCHSDGTVSLKGVTIKNNYAFNGSGLAIDQDSGEALIESCTIADNVGIDPFVYTFGDPDVVGGGGVYFSGSSLTIKDSEITGNTTYGDGAGIYVKNGTVTVSGGKVSGNNAHEEDKTGGGIYNKAAVILDGCTVADNNAYSKGGGIFNDPKATLRLCGNTKITGNEADFGGGVHAKVGSGKIYLGYADASAGESSIKVEKNSGGDMYLENGSKLTIASGGLATKSSIGVTVTASGVFTSGFSAVMGEDAVPEIYFFADDSSYLIYLDNGEAAIMLDLAEEEKFLKRSERIETDTGHLSSVNWMAGVSGERYLNEINIPGTHDTAMNNVSSFGCLSGDFGAAQAKTQKEYLFEQLEHGARFFDIRMKTYYCKDEISAGWLGILGAGVAVCIPIVGGIAATALVIATGVAIYNNSALPIYKDDGKNLWACHGRSVAGTFYALDDEDDRLSIAQELEWFKEFLTKHPTETIIIDARPETDESSGETYYGPLERLKGILEEMSTEINPSTGEPYIYWEDGIVGKKFEHWPQLKDCRGKIIFFGGKGEKITDTIGGFYKNTDGIESDSGKGGFQDGTKRADNLRDFFETHNTLQIPRDAMDDQMEDFYWVKMNTTDTMFLKTPVELADQYVLPVVLGADGYVNESKKGMYFGWFSMDAARASHYRDVWITNFPADLDYCTITVKCGYSGATAPKDQTYQVLRGSTITIPGCIYGGIRADRFAGWLADDDKIYLKNNKYRVLDDNVTFIAQWSNEVQTPVTVVWKDANDLDGIRPLELLIRYNSNQTATLKEAEDWTIMLSGDLSDDPTVDLPTKYTAQVEGEMGKDGYTITMIHTPDVKVNASGIIVWNDEDNKDGIRPNSVKLRLYANGEEVASGTASAANGWSFDLGIYDRYKDGEFVAYRLVEEEITYDEEKAYSGYTSNVEAIEGEKNAITSFKVTNAHEVTTSVMYARIDWDDDNDAAGERPESVTVQWLKDGELYGEPIVVSPDEEDEGEWVIDLELTYAEIQEIGRKQDEIAQRYQAGEMTEEEFIEAIEGTIAYSIKQERIDNYTTTVAIKNVESDEGETGVSYYQILNTYKKHEHKLTKTEAKEATCTEDGNNAYWTCDQGDDCCGKYFSDAEGTTEIEKDSWILPALGHDWSEWTSVKASSPSQEGEEERICSRCKEKETQKYMYSCTNGQGNTWNKGSKNAFTFAFKRSARDEVTFDQFSKIQIDGKKVDETNFSKQKGSLIITLNSKYLDSLSAGKHQLKVIFSDGSAEASFKISGAGGQYVIPVTGIDH